MERVLKVFQSLCEGTCSTIGIFLDKDKQVSEQEMGRTEKEREGEKEKEKERKGQKSRRFALQRREEIRELES